CEKEQHSFCFVVPLRKGTACVDFCCSFVKRKSTLCALLFLCEKEQHSHISFSKMQNLVNSAISFPQDKSFTCFTQRRHHQNLSAPIWMFCDYALLNPLDIAMTLCNEHKA